MPKAVILIAVRKRIVISVLIVLLLAVCCLAFYMTRPSVAFISTLSFPDGYVLPEPGNIFKYRMTGNMQKADIVITAPDSPVPQGVVSYLFGRDAEEGENPAAVLAIDEGKMWETALAEGSAVLLYEESSVAAKEIASHLRSVDPEIGEVVYTGRISGANADGILNEIKENGSERVFALTPSSSMALFRSTDSFQIVMDIRDAAAMETTAVSEAVSIDWDGTIENLISGSAELSYCLISL